MVMMGGVAGACRGGAWKEEEGRGERGAERGLESLDVELADPWAEEGWDELEVPAGGAVASAGTVECTVGGGCTG